MSSQNLQAPSNPKDQPATVQSPEVHPREQTRLEAIEDLFELQIFRVRWMLVPAYLILALCLIPLMWSATFDLKEAACEAFGWNCKAFTASPGRSGGNGQTASPPTTIDISARVIAPILSLVDIVLVMNLVLMVLFVGYVNFVSRIERESETDWPGWMGGLDYGGLKAHLLGSVIAIASVKVLKVFFEQLEAEKNSGKENYQRALVAFAALLGSAVVMVIVNRFKAGAELVSAKAAQQEYETKVYEREKKILVPKVPTPTKRWEWRSLTGLLVFSFRRTDPRKRYSWSWASRIGRRFDGKGQARFRVVVSIDHPGGHPFGRQEVAERDSGALVVVESEGAGGELGAPPARVPFSLVATQGERNSPATFTVDAVIPVSKSAWAFLFKGLPAAAIPADSILTESISRCAKNRALQCERSDAHKTRSG